MTVSRLDIEDERIDVEAYGNEDFGSLSVDDQDFGGRIGISDPLDFLDVSRFFKGCTRRGPVHCQAESEASIITVPVIYCDTVTVKPSHLKKSAIRFETIFRESRISIGIYP